MTYSPEVWVTRAELIEMIDELLGWSGSSEAIDISNPYPVSGKAEQSRMVLLTAGRLIAPLIVKAINHQAGMIINRVSMPFWILPNKSNEAAYARALADANADRHEFVGSRYDLSDQKVNREIVALLLKTVLTATNFPDGRLARLFMEASDALLALNEGEVLPFLLRPSTRRKGAAFTKDQLTLKASCHVAYRVGRGIQVGVAQDVVAKAYVVGLKTVQGWWERDTGPAASYDNRFYVDRARQLGQTFATRQSESGEQQSQSGEQLSGHGFYVGSEYWDERLSEDGRSFSKANGAVRQAKRQAKAKKAGVPKMRPKAGVRASGRK